MDRNTIDQMQADQRIDDLDHKIGVYDQVKATIKLCETMIKALDATCDIEYAARMNLINNLEMAGTYAMLGASDVQVEKSGLLR